MNYTIFDFGACGDGQTDDTKALQRAIDACSGCGGGQITFPSGTVCISGPLELRSHIHLYFENNAVLKAAADPSRYTRSAFRDNRSEGSVWLYGEHLCNVAISGTGEINGMGTSFMVREHKSHFEYRIEDGIDMRPHLLTLVDCCNITIRDVTFRDSAYWCIHPIGCRDVVISGIRILNSLKIRNCDGIDPDHCRNVRISDCYIESADDCICLKNRREYEEYGLCEDISVTNCILKSTSCAVKIGSENVTGIRNALFSSIIIRESNRGLGIQNRDEGFIEDISFDNIRIESRLFDDIWWGKSEPISITALRRDHNPHRSGRGNASCAVSVGPVRNISFRNISAIAENGIYVNGSVDSRPENILFDGIRLVFHKWTSYAGGVYDNRPCEEPGIVRDTTAAFYLQHADQITIRDCQIESAGSSESAGSFSPYFKEGCLAFDVEGLEIHNLVVRKKW
jgi:polygalacturonase